MKQLVYLFMLSFAVSAIAADSGKVDSQELISLNSAKYAMQSQAAQDQQEEIRQNTDKKSVLKAALFSAVLPGAGEAYAGSYWKAAVFIGLEVAFWTTNYIYNSKGDDEDVKMRAYGDEHWSEQRYWSKIYDKTKESWAGPDIEVYEPDEYGYIIIKDVFYEDPAVRAALREIESEAGYSHSLPTTKTQQYYEMIYKYPRQFGVGWDDVESFTYYDIHENTFTTTPHIAAYRDMRNASNDYYVFANTMVMMAMVNHLASAFDAAYTVNKQNKKIEYSFRMKPQFNGYDYTNTYGLNIIW